MCGKTLAWLRWLGLFAVLGLSGCGGSSFYPVEGTIQWTDGKPATELAGGFVNFESADGKTSAIGQISADARYKLTTRTEGDGARAGDYKVTLRPPMGEDADKPPPVPFHADYREIAKTKLQVTVEAKKNDLPLRIERAK